MDTRATAEDRPVRVSGSLQAAVADSTPSVYVSLVVGTPYALVGAGRALAVGGRVGRLGAAVTRRVIGRACRRQELGPLS